MNSLTLQQQADNVYVDPELLEYAVRLVGATRRPHEYRLDDIAAIRFLRRQPARFDQLDPGGRALALTRGRDYVVPPDIAS